LAIGLQQHQQQPRSGGRRLSVAAAAVVACRVCHRGGHDTLRFAADATWQPEMNYSRFGIPTAIRIVALE